MSDQTETFQALPAGYVVLKQIPGFRFIGNETTKEAIIQVSDLMENLPTEGQVLNWQRQSDEAKFIGLNNMVYQVISTGQETQETLFPTGQEYTFLSRIIDNQMFMKCGDDLYEVQGVDECTGPDCQTCASCSTCQAASGSHQC